MTTRKRIAAFAFAILVVGGSAANAAADRGPVRPRDPVEVAKVTDAKPVPGAPTVDLREGEQAAGAAGVLASYLPFNFTYDFSTALTSRLFWPSSGGSVCVNLRGTGSTDPNYYLREVRVEIWDSYGNDTKIGPTVRYALNGPYYGYCWYGLNAYHEHYFRITKDWGPARVWGDGWAAPY